MMIKQILLSTLILHTTIHAASASDQDLDGVPDTIDQCQDTPFLNEVNAKGCTTVILTLPEETESDSLNMTLGYGISTNEDLVGRATQHTAKFQMSYYRNNWSYSLRTGYFRHNKDQGKTDTVLKIKKRFKLSDDLKFALGFGIKLPTYDFQGNKTDYILYSSLSYHPTTDYSIFTGWTHTFIKDEKIFSSLQDTNSFYLGIGHFFTNNFYANLSLGISQSKFATEESNRIISSTIYYKINETWFTTLSYGREIDDEDAHNTFNLKVGYKIW